MQFFKTPFFSIIERFWTFPKIFSYDQIFWNVKCVMCGSNLASYIPPAGPLGISLPPLDVRGFHTGDFTSTFGCTGVSHRGFHKKYWKKSEKASRGYVRRPIWTTHYTFHISHDAHHRTGKVLQNGKKWAFLIISFLKQIRILWRIWFWSPIFKAESTNMLISRIWIKNRYTRMMSWSVSAEKKICTLYFSMVKRFQVLVSVSGGRVREI